MDLPRDLPMSIFRVRYHSLASRDGFEGGHSYRGQATPPDEDGGRRALVRLFRLDPASGTLVSILVDSAWVEDIGIARE